MIENFWLIKERFPVGCKVLINKCKTMSATGTIVDQSGRIGTFGGKIITFPYKDGRGVLSQSHYILSIDFDEHIRRIPVSIHDLEPI